MQTHADRRPAADRPVTTQRRKQDRASRRAPSAGTAAGNSAAQAKTAAMLNGGARVSQLVALQRKANARAPFAAQRQEGLDEDEMLQGKGLTVQRQEGLDEDEMLQGRGLTVQRQEGLDEDEMLQGKGLTVQRQEGLDEDEMLQGKGLPAQRQEGLDEDEMLQGKGLPAQRQEGLDEEEMLQGKGLPAQRQEGPFEDEMLQGKGLPVQRQEGLDEEEMLQGKGMTAQRQEGLDEDELLQGKGLTVQRQEGLDEDEMLQGKELPSQRRDAPAGGGNLPATLQAGLESLSGLDMSDVHVHRNSGKPAQLNALAYTQGKDIHLAPGQEQHLPHESWHAVQQAQGRVKPTTSAGGVAVNDDRALENEADVMGAKAAQKMDTDRISGSESGPDPDFGAVAQRLPALLDIPGKRPQESYLGWGGWRILKELGSKAVAPVRGLGSVVGGTGRALGVDLPGTYANTTIAGLNAQLQAGLTLAQANPAPGAVAGAMPPWILAGQRRPTPAAGYVPGPAAPGQPTFTNGLRNTYTARWGRTFYNDEGRLPGVRGAGGYNEYYAQPAPGAYTGVWGENRILRQTNDPTGTYWWATDDHYTTFRYISDA